MAIEIDNSSRPIGVFDSGMGGLTVLSALKKLLPQESFLYLGDMARLPYGTKSPQKVAGFAHEITQALIDSGVKLVVVACNTASTVALSALKTNFPQTPIVGVVEPGAASAIAASRTRKIAVLATEITIQSQGYQKALHALDDRVGIVPKACPLFVALAEEGLMDGDVARAAVKHYLESIKNHLDPVDCVLLACTHFPVLYGLIKEFLGERFSVVDPAQSVAKQVEHVLRQREMLRSTPTDLRDRFLVTDAPERFLRVAPFFFGQAIDPSDLSLIEL